MPEKPLRSAPKIGLALGSGSARGLAHIGVLKVLDREKIPIACIAGTSIGAFIGALYSAGVSPEQMEEVALQVDWRQMARLIDPVIPTTGLIDGRKVSGFMSGLLPVRTFEELRIPLAVTATDVETGESFTIRRGNLLEALRAAIAFPGIFTPVRWGERFLVDGGLCNPVPIQLARDLGADKVVGVCAIPEVAKPGAETEFPSPQSTQEKREGSLPLFSAVRFERLWKDLWRPNGSSKEKANGAPSERERKPPGILRICAQSVAIMENQINALRLDRDEIDLLIRPDLNDITLLEFHRAQEAIRAGEEATLQLLPALRTMAGLD